MIPFHAHMAGWLHTVQVCETLLSSQAHPTHAQHLRELEEYLRHLERMCIVKPTIIRAGQQYAASLPTLATTLHNTADEAIAALRQRVKEQE